jgi:tetratricopeptide (TPR) repeat protein
MLDVVLDTSVGPEGLAKAVLEDLQSGLAATTGPPRSVMVRKAEGYDRSRAADGNIVFLGLEADQNGTSKQLTGNLILTAFAPDNFANLGLCFWRADGEGALKPEANAIRFPASSTTAIQSVAHTLLGVDAQLLGAHSDAAIWYEQALALGEPIGLPAHYLLWWTGLAYLGRGEDHGCTAFFDKAIRCFKEALIRLGGEPHPVARASLQGALGRAYSQRPSDSPFELCQLALSYLDSALQGFDRSTYPVDCARLLYTRASAYQYLPRGKDPDALAKARQDIENCLTLFDQKRFPVLYAQCQNSLGHLYALWKFDPVEHQRLAQQCFVRALEIRTKERFPWQYAQTQHNLGCLLTRSLYGDECANLRRAVTCLVEALSVFDRVRFPYRRIQALGALGRAYARLSSLPGESSEQAVHCFNEVGLLLSPEENPYLHAQNLCDLAAALQGSHPERAIRLYEQALQTFSKDRFPVEHGTALVAMAELIVLAPGRVSIYNLADIFSFYNEALDCFSLDSFPFEHGCVQASLASLILSLPAEVGGSAKATAISRYQQAGAAFARAGCLNERDLVQEHLQEVLNIDEKTAARM